MIIRLEMKNYKLILIEKQEKYLQYHQLINILINGKIDKNEYLTGKVKMPSDQIQFIEEGKFTYSTLEKALEKETEKEKEALKYLQPSGKTN